MYNPLVDIKKLTATATTPDNWGLLATDDKQQKGATGIAELLSLLVQHTTIHYMSDGAWSMHQLLLALMSTTGIADVYITTYSISERAMRSLNKLKEEGLLNRLYFLIDNRVETRTANGYQMLLSLATQYKPVACHAKVTIIKGERQNYCIVGSANYTENKRFETGFVTTDASTIAFHEQWITAELAKNG